MTSVLVNQVWPIELKRQMAELAARKGVSLAELTRRAVEAQYAEELKEC